MLISALILAINRSFWLFVGCGCLFALIGVPVSTVFLFSGGIGLICVFSAIVFFRLRKISYQNLLQRFLESMPNLPSDANRILTAALDFQQHPAMFDQGESQQLRSLVLRDAENLLQRFDPETLVPVAQVRKSVFVSLALVLLIAGFAFFHFPSPVRKYPFQKFGDSGNHVTVSKSTEKHNENINENEPKTENAQNSTKIEPSPLTGQNSEQEVVVEQQVSLFLRTKKELVALLGKSQSRLSPEKRQLLAAMSQRQEIISTNQNDTVKRLMHENTKLFVENRLGQSLQLQRDIFVALGRDPDQDFGNVLPFVPESLYAAPTQEQNSGYEFLSAHENSIGSDFAENHSESGDSSDTSLDSATASTPSQGMGKTDPVRNSQLNDFSQQERYAGHWGELPESEQRLGREISQEQIVPEYKKTIDRYFRSLFRNR